MKDILKNAWFNWFITTLFERIPGLKKVFAFFDGHKTTIGRLLLAAAALLAFLTATDTGVCHHFPDWCASHPKFNEYAMKLLAGIGWLITELGLQHKTAKDMNGEGVVEDQDL